MRLLKNLKTKSSERINVIAEAATKWQTIANYLDFNESAVRGLKSKYPNDVNNQACCDEMMEMWVFGEGRQPATWELLMKTLHKCELEELAQQVEEAIK